MFGRPANERIRTLEAEAPRTWFNPSEVRMPRTQNHERKAEKLKRWELGKWGPSDSKVQDPWGRLIGDKA